MSVYAQSAGIQGIITKKADGQPIRGANVLLLNDYMEQVKGAVTDQNGFYRLSNIDPGEYIFRVSYVGFTTHLDTIQVESQEGSSTYSIALADDSAQLDEFDVSVKREAARIRGGHQRVSAIDLNQVVTPAGGGDIASYLQALPGVVSTGDRGGQLFVRGGTPSENMVLVDGQVIYQPFHIVGFFSAFPEQLLANADFYAGGFSPKYQGRTSSVLDVQMRDGDLNDTRGTVALSPFIAELQMEGPLKEGSSSWIASFRSSQIERTSDFVIGETQPLKFDSQFIKLSTLSENGTRCSAMAMRTYDRGKLDFEGGDSFSWSNFVLGGNCTHLAQDPDLFIDLNFGLSNLKNSLGGGGTSDLSSGVTRFGVKFDVTQYSGNIRLNYGFDSHMKWINYDIEELFQISQISTDVLLGAGGYLEAEIPLSDKLRIHPGAAVSLYANAYKPTFEPRFKAVWQPNGSSSQEVNASVGVYRQTLAGITDLRDAGSAFIAWLPTPNDERMEAIHALLGWQKDMGSNFQVSIESYYKRLSNIPVSVWSTIAEFTTEVDYANGNVYGGDVRLEYGNPNFYGFVGYGLSWTKYESAQDNFNEWFGTPVQSYHPAHDRRHQINSMASYYLGKFTLSARWQLGTGLPYTRQMGSDSILPFGEGLPNPRNQYGTPRVILDKPFKARTPTYHRLDVSLEREFNFNDADLFIQVGAINTYGKTNLFYYDVFTQRRIDQLPFAPYLSLKTKF